MFSELLHNRDIVCEEALSIRGADWRENHQSCLSNLTATLATASTANEIFCSRLKNHQKIDLVS